MDDSHRASSRFLATPLPSKRREGSTTPYVTTALRPPSSPGIRYAFAATPGGIQRGVPTCWKAPGLDELVKVSKDESFVWPAPNGTARGQAIEPLHSGVLLASGENKDLYRLLALTDILRVGAARERRVAAKELEKELR